MRKFSRDAFRGERSCIRLSHLVGKGGGGNKTGDLLFGKGVRYST